MTIISTKDRAFHLPKINLNGTSARSLEEEYHAALKAIRIAETLLAKATCHGRDFQMQDPSDFEYARMERIDMLTSLGEVEDYLEAWYWNAVDAQ